MKSKRKKERKKKKERKAKCINNDISGGMFNPTVIVVEKGICDQSLNPVQSSLCFISY